MKIKKILVSQPAPENGKSPYFELADKNNLAIDFRPFIEVEPVSVSDFRNQKVDILSHTGIIFTSRNAVDNFFRVCEELKVEIPADMKYYCIPKLDL